MIQETTQKAITKQVRDHLPILTKIAYGLVTGLDMWGLWLYPAVAFAVFNIYLGAEPWLVGFDYSIALQSTDTIFWIRAILASIPVFGLILVIMFVLKVKLTKQKCAEISAVLEERRGTV